MWESWDAIRKRDEERKKRDDEQRQRAAKERKRVQQAKEAKKLKEKKAEADREKKEKRQQEANEQADALFKQGEEEKKKVTVSLNRGFGGSMGASAPKPRGPAGGFMESIYANTPGLNNGEQKQLAWQNSHSQFRTGDPEKALKAAEASKNSSGGVKGGGVSLKRGLW